MLLRIFTATAIISLFLLIKKLIKMKSKKTLYIIRGIPGSGKSTLAKTLASEKQIDYFEADMYFTNEEGEYVFDSTKLQRAHDWCFDRVLRRLLLDQSVIVSNTFTRWREMREYVESAQENGFNVEVITCLGDFGSVHGVPESIMERMRERFIPNSGLPQLKGITFSEYLAVAECANTVVTF